MSGAPVRPVFIRRSLAGLWACGRVLTGCPQPRKTAPDKNRTNRGRGGCWKRRRTKDKKDKVI